MWTPLHFAADSGHLQTCEFLLRSNADKTIKDADGRTAADVAKTAEIKNMILNYNSVPSVSAAPMPIIVSNTIEHSKNDIINQLETIVKQIDGDIKFKKVEDVKQWIEKRETKMQQMKQKIQQQEETIQEMQRKKDKSQTEIESLGEQIEDLIQQIESCSTQIHQMIEKQNILTQQNGLLGRQVELLKQNEITVMLSELKLQKKQKYDAMLEELLQIQTCLLSEKDATAKQRLITDRNKMRREIVRCIDELTSDAQSQLKPRTELLVQQMIDKKLQSLFPVKSELEKDMSMEEELKEMSNHSVTTMQQQLELHRQNLIVLERLNLQDHIVSTKQQIRELEQKIQKQKETLSMVSKRKNPLFGFPELQESFMSTVNQEKIDDLNKSYIVEKMGNKFIIATKKDTNEKVFMKKYENVNEWKFFKNEVETLQRLNHQCIVTINKAMFDEHFYYIEMPFIANGTLYNWLLKSNSTALHSMNQRTPFEVQRMMRLVIQTIDYLHENGVVHRDLKMENIMMQNEVTPVIIDFDMSKDNQNSQRMSVSTMAGGTLKYIDPQVQWGIGTLTTKSDIYSFGVTLLKCFSKFPLKMEVIPMPNKDAPDIKSSDLIVEDADLVQILKRCLHIKQEERPSAKEIINCAFFMKHMSNEHENEKKEDATTRIQAFKKYISEKKASIRVDRVGFPSMLNMSINEDKLEVELGDKLMKTPKSEMYKILCVTFEGQLGIDAGGLTTSLFRKYFLKLISTQVFEKGSGCVHICVDSFDAQSNATEKRALFYRSIGLVLAKCIVEQRSIGEAQLSNVLLKYLLAKDVNKVQASLVDLEQFDAKQSNDLSNMRLMKDVSELYLDFTGLKAQGGETELTNDNLEEYIRLKCQYEMITSRKQHLEWMREGFYMMPEIQDHFQLLHVSDYQILLTGEQMIDIPAIVDNCIAFLSGDQQQMQQWLKEVLLSFSQEEFKQFLLFCTGYCTTQTKNTIFQNQNPHFGYDCHKINVNWMTRETSDALPVAHLCSYVLDMPLYKSKEQMEQKLKYAISNTSDFFAIA